MQKPAFEYKVNITTVVALVGLVATLWNASARYTRLETLALNLTSEASSWRNDHMIYHRDRATEAAQIVARTDERLKSLEGQGRAIDNLTYRMTIQEQGTTSLTAAVAELRQTINDVTGDIRLIREIVTRMENASPNGKAEQHSR